MGVYGGGVGPLSCLASVPVRKINSGVWNVAMFVCRALYCVYILDAFIFQLQSIILKGLNSLFHL